MTVGAVLVRDASASELACEAFGEHADACEKVLWLEGSARAALLHLGPHVTLKAHTHASKVHHVLVVNGSALICGQRVQPGSYLFVPPGVEHDAVAGTHGCTLFYLILPAATHGGGEFDGSEGAAAPAGDGVHARDIDR